LQGQQYYSDKLTLSFDGFYRKKPKSECLVPSRHPDFAGMMRPGHDQSTPFGLSTSKRISTVPDSGRAKLPLCLGRSVGEREVPAIGQAKTSPCSFCGNLGVAAATPYLGKWMNFHVWLEAGFRLA
jgi:hypothetical protein